MYSTLFPCNSGKRFFSTNTVIRFLLHEHTPPYKILLSFALGRRTVSLSLKFESECTVAHEIGPLFCSFLCLSFQPASFLIILISIRRTHLHRVFTYLISSTRQRPSYQLLLYPPSIFQLTIQQVSSYHVHIYVFGRTPLLLGWLWLGRGSTYSQYAESIDQCLGVERYSFVAL